MSTERLQQILRSIADDAGAVSLEEEALAHSRRTTARKTALAAAAAVLLLAGGIIGAANVWGGGKPTPAPATSATPSHTATPSPSESEETPDGVITHDYDGTFYYLEPFDGGARLLAGRVASAPDVVLVGDSTMLITANVSPDGKWLSWVDERNKLMLRELATGVQRELMDYAPGDICREPTWSVTSRWLLAASPEDRLGTYDITTDTFTPLGFDVEGCHPRPVERPGAETHVAYLDAAEQTVVEVDMEGAVVAETPVKVPGRDVNDLTGGGADGEYYCFQTTEAGAPGGDAARGNACDTVGEPGDPGLATRNPGAGKLLQFTGGMARKEVDGVKVLTPDLFDDDLEFGEFTAEHPSLDDAWLLAFVPDE